MFTIRQNKTFGLTRNGLKWEHNTLAVAPVASNSADSLTKAKGLLKKIKESIFDTTELKELQELLKKAKVENDTKKDDLYSLLNDALKPDSGFSERDKADIQKIKDAWDKDFRDMDATNTKDTQEKKAEVKKVFATAKVEMPPENKKLSELTREANGELTLDSMQFVLADLDGSGEIESTNRGWFKRTFLGGGEQHFPIGELQVLNELKDHIKNRESMNSLAQRLGVALPWDSKLDAISIHRDYKVQAFRKALIEQVSDVASVASLILGDEKSRTGLTSVITGNTQELQNALKTNKNALKNIQAFVEKNPNMAERILAALVRVGIMLPLAILSGGMAVGFVETTDLSKKEGETGSLTTKKALGKSGSIAASIDALGIRLEANTNDQGVRILGRTKTFLDAVKPKDEKTIPTKDNVMKSVDDAIKVTIEDIKDEKKKVELTKLSETYKKSQEKIMRAFESNALTASDVPALLDQLTQNTFTYYARVEELQDFQFKGFWAGIMKQGIGLGLSGAMTSVSYSDNGTRLDAAVGEASLGAHRKILTQPEKVSLLKGERYSYSVTDGIKTIKIKGYNKDEVLSPDLEKLKNSGHLTIDGDIISIKTKTETETIFASPKIINRVDGGKTTLFEFSINGGKKDVKFEEKDGVVTITGYKNGEGMNFLTSLGDRAIQNNDGTITVTPKNGETLELDGQKVTVKSKKGVVDIAETTLYSQDAQDILKDYPQASEWRRKYPKAFGIMQGHIMSGKVTEAWVALGNINNKDIKALIKAGQDKIDAVKEDILSSLVNETVGIKDFRNYGKSENKDKRTFGQVHKLTHPKSVMSQYDFHDAQVFGFQNLKEAMADSEFKEYITAKRASRTALHKRLDVSKDKTKPTEKLNDENGYFTLLNFAQVNGGLNGLKSQHVNEIVKSSESEISGLTQHQKARFLSTVFNDSRYKDRVDALKISAKSGMTGSEDLTNQDLANMLILGQTVRGVKLEEPIKFFRAEYSKCANEMIMISKPKFVSENKNTTVVTLNTPSMITEDFVGRGSTVGSDTVSTLSGGLGAGISWDKVNGESGSNDGPKTNPGGGPETPMDPKVPGAPLTPSPSPIPAPTPTPIVTPGSGA